MFGICTMGHFISMDTVWIIYMIKVNVLYKRTSDIWQPLISTTLYQQIWDILAQDVEIIVLQKKKKKKKQTNKKKNKSKKYKHLILPVFHELVQICRNMPTHLQDLGQFLLSSETILELYWSYVLSKTTYNDVTLHYEWRKPKSVNSYIQYVQRENVPRSEVNKQAPLF